MEIIKLHIVALFCIISVCVSAQNVYQIDSIYPVHPLDQYLLVLEDSTSKLGIKEVISVDKNEFQPLENYNLNLRKNSTYWAILKLHSDETIKNWILNLEEDNKSIGGWGRANSKVDIWAYSNHKQVWHKKTGATYPKTEKDFKTLWNQNRINFNINEGDTLQLFIKVEANKFGFPPFFNLVLRNPKFQDHHPFYDKHTFLNKILFGATLIFLLYYFLSFLYLKEDVFIWFAIWLFFTAMTVAINTDIGLVDEYLLSDSPGLQLYLWPLVTNSVTYTFWLFGRVFIGTKHKFPILDKFILGLIILIIVETVIYLISLPLPIGNRQFYVILFNSIEAFFNFAGIVLALMLTFKKDKLSRYFGIGALLGNIAIIIGVLWVTGILQLPFDPFVWGIILQLVAYSFGLVYRKQLKNKAFKKSQLDLISAERASLELRRKAEFDDLKSKFFANISHEFRTPLSLIMGPLKLAKKESNVDILISRKKYDIVERNTERLKELVDQLLDLSKIESGLTDFRLTQGGLMDFINTIASDFESIALEKNITYNIRTDIGDNDAFYDKDKLQKIIHNLLSNAFKFTPGGNSVNFRCKLDPINLLLEIEDTGSGIPEDQIKKIYDRFYRLESTESKGSGIGLALTKELVDLLNGQIKVRSQLGEGTCFYVTIPTQVNALPKSVSIKLNKVKQEHLIDHGAELNGEDKVDIPTVLIVEDNEDLRTFISEILEPHYSIILADNGEIGERLALEHIPNIIVSDVMMPKRNGYELCKALKSNIITSHIPIILLTAKAGQENKMSGLTYGADAYMTKPFDSEELLVRINNFIEARMKIWSQFKMFGGSIAGDLSLSSMDDQFFQKIQKEINEQFSNEQFSVEDLAKAVGFSRSQLHRKLKALINKTASQLIRETRLHRAKLILEKKSMNVSETAYEVGFTNLSYFAKAFKDYYGYLPSDLK